RPNIEDHLFDHRVISLSRDKVERLKKRRISECSEFPVAHVPAEDDPAAALGLGLLIRSVKGRIWRVFDQLADLGGLHTGELADNAKHAAHIAKRTFEYLLAFWLRAVWKR